MNEKDIQFVQHPTDPVLRKVMAGDKDTGFDVIQWEDGFWYLWEEQSPRKHGGLTAGWILRGIADRLDELNRPWEEMLSAQATPAS
jgi:hypothetical protein